MPDQNHKTISPVLILALGILAASTASTFIRLSQAAGVEALAIAAWRLTFASLILAPIALFTQRRELARLTRREWILALGSGVFLAIHFASWIASLSLTSVAASAVLVATNPLFVGLASYLFLGERMSRATTLGLGVSMIGSIIIGWGDLIGGSDQLWGDLLALLGAAAGAGYFMIGRRLRERLSLLGYVFPVYGTAAILLMLLAGVSRTPLQGYAPDAWLWLLLLGLVPQILGHSSLNWALRHLTATYVTLATLAEPIGAALLVWIVLSERPPLEAVIGGTLVLLGVVIAGRRR